MGIVAPNTLLEYLHGFPQARIVILGDIMIDQFIWGTVNRISPEAPVPVVEVKEETFLLGGAANVANNIYSLGGKLALCGVLGEDEMSKKILKDLEEKNVDTEGVIILKDRPTTKKIRVIAHNQQVVRFDYEKRIPIPLEAREKLKAILEKKLKGYHALLISDYAKGVISPGYLDEIIPMYRENGKIVVVDPKVSNIHYYKGVTGLTPNSFEALRMVGINHEEEEGHIEAGKILLEKMGCDWVLITRGERGITLFDIDGEISHIPTTAKEVYDVTGAGDTVIATLTLALASRGNIKEAAIMANLAAGIVVGELGTVPIKVEKLRKAVSTQ